MANFHFKLFVFLASVYCCCASSAPSHALKRDGVSGFLRGSGDREQQQQQRQLNPTYCGCSGCTDAAFEVFAGDFKCGDRINYLKNTAGFSERDACARVAGQEFPAECGVCDPDSCSEDDVDVVDDQEEEPDVAPGPLSTGKCGCPECDGVWGVMAGDYSCGMRIEWLQSDMATIVAGPYDEATACSMIAADEFPGECGKCDPSSCNSNSDNDATPAPTKNPTKTPTAAPTLSPTRSPTATPTQSPTKPPTRSPTKEPTKAPTSSPNIFNHDGDGDNESHVCGCPTCDTSVWNTFAGEYKCGDRINYLKNDLAFSEQDACARIGGIEFPVECGGCDPDRCVVLEPDFNNNNNGNSNDNNGNNQGQKCGGAVNSSGDSDRVCRDDLWNPASDSSMHCFAYGGVGDPCHLSNNNDSSHGRFKDPSLCRDKGDTFYLWDEPDTQGKSYSWAGRTWLEYSRRFPNELREMRSRGIKVTGPLLKAGAGGVLERNMGNFYDSCGSPCSDPSDPAYIDVLAINAFCGDFNGSAGCRGGASFIYREAVQLSSSFDNLPVYITNWSRLQTSNPFDQVDAIESIDEFFPPSSVVERVYWFGATDFGGGSSNNFLTNVLPDGSTLGELWKNKCESL